MGRKQLHLNKPYHIYREYQFSLGELQKLETENPINPASHYQCQSQGVHSQAAHSEKDQKSCWHDAITCCVLHKLHFKIISQHVYNILLHFRKKLIY